MGVAGSLEFWGAIQLHKNLCSMLFRGIDPDGMGVYRIESGKRE